MNFIAQAVFNCENSHEVFMSSLLIYAAVLTASSSSYTCRVHQTTAQLVQWFCCVQETVFFKKKSGTFFFANYYLIENFHMNSSFYFLSLCAPSRFSASHPPTTIDFHIFWIFLPLPHNVYWALCGKDILKKPQFGLMISEFFILWTLESCRLSY